MGEGWSVRRGRGCAVELEVIEGNPGSPKMGNPKRLWGGSNTESVGAGLTREARKVHTYLLERQNDEIPKPTFRNHLMEGKGSGEVAASARVAKG